MLARPMTMPWYGVGVVAAPLVFVVVVSSMFVSLCLSTFCTSLSPSSSLSLFCMEIFMYKISFMPICI